MLKSLSQHYLNLFESDIDSNKNALSTLFVVIWYILNTSVLVPLLLVPQPHSCKCKNTQFQSAQ